MSFGMEAMGRLKTCVECRDTSLRDGTVSHELTIDGVSFVVEGMLADICDACGESYVAGQELERAELTVAAELARCGMRSGESFRFMRKALGLRANALAELFDLQPETLSRWEKGTQTLDSCAFALLGSLVVDRLEGRGESALARLRALRQPVKASAPVRVCRRPGERMSASATSAGLAIAAAAGARTRRLSGA